MKLSSAQKATLRFGDPQRQLTLIHILSTSLLVSVLYSSDEELVDTKSRCLLKDPHFCSRLGVLLDREESGWICFDRLLHFISNVLDTERTPPRFLACSLEEECFNQLEWQLSKDFSRMLYNKHNKATTESFARRFEREVPEEPVVPRPSTPRCAGTPRRTRPGSARSERERSPEQGTPRLSRCHLLYHQAVLAARMLGFRWKKPTPRDLWFGIVFHFLMDWRWIRYPGTHHFLMVKIHEFVCNGFG